MKRKNGMR